MPIVSTGSSPVQCESRSSQEACCRVRNAAVVRQHPLPRLQRPVGPVGRLAGDDLPRERRAVVGTAPVAERLPGIRPRLAPPTRVVEPEGNLRARMGRSDRVDGVPRKDVLDLAAGRERDHRFALGVDGELHVVGVPVDQLRGVRTRREHARHSDRQDKWDIPQRGSPPREQLPNLCRRTRPGSRSLARVPSIEARPVSVSRL